MRWRNDNKAHRLTIQLGPASDAMFIGFEGWPAPLAKLSSGRLSPELMTMTWLGGLPARAVCHNHPTRRKFQRSTRTATTMMRIASG